MLRLKVICRDESEHRAKTGNRFCKRLVVRGRASVAGWVFSRHPSTATEGDCKVPPFGYGYTAHPPLLIVAPPPLLVVAPPFANLSTQESLNSATLLTVIMAPETVPHP